MPMPQVYGQKLKKVVGTGLTTKQHEALVKYCKDHGITPSKLIRDMLLERIGYREPEKDT